MEVSFARFDLCLDKGECAPCPESFFDAFASEGLAVRKPRNTRYARHISYLTARRAMLISKKKRGGPKQIRKQINICPLLELHQ